MTTWQQQSLTPEHKLCQNLTFKIFCTEKERKGEQWNRETAKIQDMLNIQNLSYQLAEINASLKGILSAFC